MTLLTSILKEAKVSNSNPVFLLRMQHIFWSIERMQHYLVTYNIFSFVAYFKKNKNTTLFRKMGRKVNTTSCSYISELTKKRKKKKENEKTEATRR